ncbi:MAG: hypothetical protein DI613_07220 [Kocuria rhizophila]|jgi:hypothetical protein|uniref:hypothetical protein n=1 Tax=Sphingomonas TaxID=13687 RepID=UPI00037F441D|nr:hypothetical protein [Sphingomonas melonis]PZP33142.1 MAG: hypothetical protein DI613_07220 [Kocuria rhizophila]ATI56863.1 hypothetical protein CP552_14605 [Sphingomonas melonis]MBX8846502.1 hypothetical protein [Sphingomonas melonis]MBX8855548.1 hypothetical protein [Sphingomonas melonis]MBX8900557.1 hypothetical protein [Sphingomonas melonis]
MIYQADLDPQDVELAALFREHAADLRAMMADLRTASNMLVRRDQSEDDELATLDRIRHILTDLTDGHEELADGFEAAAQLYDGTVIDRLALASAPTPHARPPLLTGAIGAGHALLLLLGAVSAITLAIAGIKELRPAPAGTPYTLTETFNGDR